MLALPADAARLRKRLFHHRRGIDEDLDLAAIGFRDPGGEPLQPPFEDIMIIGACRAAVIDSIRLSRMYG